MISEETQGTIAALETLLERERSALIAGDFDALVDQFDEKKTLIDRLNGSGEAVDVSLSGLQAKALRNQALLDSALRGIRSVANRMNTLSRIRQTLDTYDESGQRQTIEGQPSRKMEKRA